MTLLELLANPNVLTILTSGVTLAVGWLAGGHGKVSVPAGVAGVLPGLLPALGQLAAHQQSRQSHALLQDLAQLAKDAGALLTPTTPAAAK